MTLETPNNTGPMVLPAALRKYNLEGRSGSKHERSKTSSSPQLSPPPPEPSVSKSLNAVSTLPKDQFSSESLDSASSTLNNGSVEIFKTFPVSMGDPCYIVLPAALKKCGINAPWEQYALYIVYGDKERCLGMEEKPLILFKQLDKEGSPCSC
jgi:hypothetical protein